MEKEEDSVEKILGLLSKISFELDQIRKGYEDIEVLKKWMKETDIYVTFCAEGWNGGEFCPNLYSHDFNEISKAAIEVIYKRLEQRNTKTLGYVREIQEMLTYVEEETNEQ